MAAPAKFNLYLIALRDIQIDEQLTIEYNWTADCAIQCDCRSENCVGWIVCDEELDEVIEMNGDIEYDWPEPRPEDSPPVVDRELAALEQKRFQPVGGTNEIPNGEQMSATASGVPSCPSAES